MAETETGVEIGNNLTEWIFIKIPLGFIKILQIVMCRTTYFTTHIYHLQYISLFDPERLKPANKRATQ